MAWGSLKQLFSGECERRLNAIVQSDTPVYDPGWAAAELEDLRHNPRISKRLKETITGYMATFYVAAGDQLLKGRLTFPSESDAWRILAAVKEVRESEAKLGYPSFETRHELDEAFHGGLNMYDRAAHVGDPRGYSGRASQFVHVADMTLLQVYFVRSPRMRMSRYDSDSKPVHHGSVLFGYSLGPNLRDIEFADELQWLYEQAKAAYEEAITMDPTDAKSYMALAQILRQFGQAQESLSRLDKALTILNRGLQADGSDKDSYADRAEVFEQLGQTGQAVADLERVLALTTWDIEAQSVRERIDTLRKLSAT